MKVLVTLLFQFLFSALVAAQSGYLDTTFAGTGFVVQDIGGKTYDGVAQVLVQQDQKMIAVGGSSASGILLTRYLEDGTPDPGFGSNGIVSLRIAGNNGTGFAIEQQPDEKLVIAASVTRNGQQDWGLVRFHPSGQIDSTFGTNGYVITDIVDGYENPGDLTIQPDGKIVVVGSIPSKTFSDMAVVRYTDDGRLDEDFGTNGIVITNFRLEDVAQKVIIQPDGKILVGGYSSVNAIGDFAMVRYTPEGDIDESFGDDGKVLTDFEQGSDWSRSMELLPDGKILMAGNVNYYNLEFLSEYGLARYNDDGSLDSTFSEDGKEIYREGTKSDANAMALQPDGKIILTGTSDFPTSVLQWFVTRILPTGERDSTFGENGIVITDIPGANEYGNSVAISRDTRIYIGGAVFTGSHTDVVVARYVADFIIDVSVIPPTCFGGNDGEIIVDEVIGGVPPYQYEISSVESPGPGIGEAGTFILVITDAIGTSATYGPFEVPSPPPPADVVVQVSDNDVFILVEGNPLFTISINGGTQLADDQFLDVPDGQHLIEVFDENGCVIFSGDIIIDATATQETFNQSNFSIFPNPGTGIFTVSFHGNAFPDAIEVFDVFGNLVLSKESISEHTVSIDLSGKPAGMYAVKVSGEQPGSLSKLIFCLPDR